MRLVIALAVFAGLAVAPRPGFAGTVDTGDGSLPVEVMADGLDTPWAIGILPDGGFLVTERDGRLIHFGQGGRVEVAGVPPVAASGQGGLLDVTVARDFDRTREIFLTFSRPQPGGAGTALASARLSEDASRLQDVAILFEAAPGFSGGRHFGSRVVEARDGTLFVTTGDRGVRPSAQDRGNHNGSVIRVNRDGSVPRDNPFVGLPGLQPEIWSYGHRNPQGAGLDRQGVLWIAEHGARGGDEVNRIEKGGNYGWPVISYGRHYSGARIGEGTSAPGLKQPEFHWDPSMAPSGLMVYSGKLRPEWAGDIFVGALKFDYIARLSGDPLREAAQIEGAPTARVRDIVEAPDGSIWFLSVGQGAVYRLVP